jgi:ABC-type phosphate transport system ATPase subunit
VLQVPVNTAPSSRPELYDREREREELDKVRKSEPTAVIVLVGPPSCGKTALLRDSYLNHAHAVYIDCREAAASTPGSFLSYMLTKLLKKVPVDAQKQAISVLKSIFQGVLKIPNTMKFTEGSTDSVQWDLQVAGFFKALGDSFNAAPKESDAGLGQVTAAFRCVGNTLFGVLCSVCSSLTHCTGLLF